MKKVSVVYLCGYGHTTNQAQAVIGGINSIEEVTSTLIPISPDGELSEADWEALDTSDAIIFGSPTYMVMVSWQFRKFADASSKRWFNQAWKNKIAAARALPTRHR